MQSVDEIDTWQQGFTSHLGPPKNCHPKLKFKLVRQNASNAGQPVINIIQILRAAFALNFFCQKNYKAKHTVSKERRLCLL